MNFTDFNNPHEQDTITVSAAAMAKCREALGREFYGGTRVTNCIAHASKPFDDRPPSCSLCQTDIANQLAFAISVNEHLNKCLNDAREAIAAIGGAK